MNADGRHIQKRESGENAVTREPRKPPGYIQSPRRTVQRPRTLGTFSAIQHHADKLFIVDTTIAVLMPWPYFLGNVFGINIYTIGWRTQHYAGSTVSGDTTGNLELQWPHQSCHMGGRNSQVNILPSWSATGYWPCVEGHELGQGSNP